MIEAIKSDIVVVQKEINRCMIVNITVPGDVTVERKGKEKIEKYGNLCKKLGRANPKLHEPYMHIFTSASQQRQYGKL